MVKGKGLGRRRESLSKDVMLRMHIVGTGRQGNSLSIREMRFDKLSEVRLWGPSKEFGV